MLTNGFISLHRSLLKWEWYDNINTTRLFIHLLLTVNYYDKDWRGLIIKRGQIVTSVAKLSKETGLTTRQIRVATTHLISTNEVTIQTTPQYSIITVLQYDKYQEATNKMTDERQTNDKQTTNKTSHERQLINNINKTNKEIKNNTIINYSEFPFFETDMKDIILDFVEHRKRLNKPLSKYALELLLKKLEKLSCNTEIQKKILTQSIENGWQGIFDLKQIATPYQKSKPSNVGNFKQRENMVEEYESMFTDVTQFGKE